MTTYEVLLTARGLIEKPEAWTKGAFARNAEGSKVSIRHPHAVAFSLEGSLYRVQWITKAAIFEAYQTLKVCLIPGGYVPLAHFNDANMTTHSAVIKLLNHAISLYGEVPPLELDE